MKEKKIVIMHLVSLILCHWWKFQLILWFICSRLLEVSDCEFFVFFVLSLVLAKKKYLLLFVAFTKINNNYNNIRRLLKYKYFQIFSFNSIIFIKASINNNNNNYQNQSKRSHTCFDKKKFQINNMHHALNTEKKERRNLFVFFLLKSIINKKTIPIYSCISKQKQPNPI